MAKPLLSSHSFRFVNTVFAVIEALGYEVFVSHGQNFGQEFYKMNTVVNRSIARCVRKY